MPEPYQIGQEVIIGRRLTNVPGSPKSVTPNSEDPDHLYFTRHQVTIDIGTVAEIMEGPDSNGKYRLWVANLRADVLLGPDSFTPYKKR